MTPRLRLVCVALSVLVPPLALRVQLLKGATGSVGILGDDVAGWVADFGVSGFVLLTVLVGRRSGGLFFWGALLVWIAVNVVSFESIRALDALPSIGDAGYLGDSTFVQGSGLQALATGLVPWVVVASLLLAWAGRRARVGIRQLLLGLVASGALLALHGSLAWNPDAADWRQTHALVHAFDEMTGTLTDAGPPVPSDVDVDEVTHNLAADLSGASRIGPRPPQPNVLLVLVESISGAYLPHAARAHGWVAHPTMPGLDAFARDHLSFTSFVTHQINTNRGLYAALCGDLPKLLPGTPKMSMHATQGLDNCLPRLLRDAGYRTVYLQAAPLAFMLKDQFMPRIGFEQVIGASAFEEAHARSAWGVDDGALFERATDLISWLEGGDGPWFATLLTVGTHHPYLVPDDFAPDEGDDFARAVAYADREATRFLDDLVKSGLLENTLVLVSSDESRGVRGVRGEQDEGDKTDGRDEVSRLASQSWGFLVAAGPGIETGLVNQPFATSDLPLSVLDYLGMEDAALAAGLLGRSVFRHPPRDRYIFFGNTRRHAAGAIDPEGRLLLCRRRFRYCEAFDVSGGIFSATRRSVEWEAEGGGIVAAVAEWSLTSGVPAGPVDTLELMASKQIQLENDFRMLHGGQNVELGPGEWIEVELSLRSTGSAAVELRHILRDPIRVQLDESRRVPAGGSYRLSYAFVPEQPVEKIQCMSMARRTGGVARASTSLSFETARLHVRSGDDRPAPGLTILRDESGR